MTKVLVVDDSEVGRLGRETALSRTGYVACAASWAALCASPDLADVDVVLLMVRRDLAAWDRFEAMREAGNVRHLVRGASRIVVAVDAAGYANPVFWLRAEALGADEIVSIDQFRTLENLSQLVSGRVRGKAPRPSTFELRAIGAGRRCDPALIIERILEWAEVDADFLRAFDPGLQQNQCGLSRRRAHTLRTKIASMGDLQPSASHSVGGPLRDTSLPRWPEMVAFVNLCRGFAEAANELSSGRPVESSVVA